MNIDEIKMFAKNENIQKIGSEYIQSGHKNGSVI